MDAHDDGDKACAVCWEEIASRDARLTPCGHVFCAGCLAKILAGSGAGRCPLCRTFLAAGDLLRVHHGHGSRKDRAKKSPKKGTIVVSKGGLPVREGKSTQSKKKKKENAGEESEERAALLADDDSDAQITLSSGEESSDSARSVSSSVSGSGSGSEEAEKSLPVVDVIESVVQSGRGAGVRVAAAAQWPSALPFISKESSNPHAVTAAVKRAWIAIEFGQALRIQPRSFTLCRTTHAPPPKRFVLQGSTRPNIVHDVDPQTLALDDSDWFPLGTYDTTASEWGVNESTVLDVTEADLGASASIIAPAGGETPVSRTFEVKVQPYRWCTAVRVMMDGPNFGGTQELSVCDFRVFGAVRQHDASATASLPGLEEERLRQQMLARFHRAELERAQGSSSNQIAVRMLLRLVSCVCTIFITFGIIFFIDSR